MLPGSVFCPGLTGSRAIFLSNGSCVCSLTCPAVKSKMLTEAEVLFYPNAACAPQHQQPFSAAMAVLYVPFAVLYFFYCTFTIIMVINEGSVSGKTAL